MHLCKTGGIIHPGPLLAGNVLNEGTLFVSFFAKPLSNDEYRVLVPVLMHLAFNISIGDGILAVLDYPCDRYNASDCRYAAAQLVGDFLIFCPTTFILEQKAKHANGTNVFAYMFDHVPSYSTNYFLGAYHASEVQYVFETIPSVATPEEFVLAKDMSSAWVAFAKNDDPSTLSQGLWNKFTNLIRARRRLNIGKWTTTIDGPLTCKFWYDVVYPKYYSLSATRAEAGVCDYCVCNPQTQNCITPGFTCRRDAVVESCGGPVILEQFRCVGEAIPFEFPPGPQFLF